MQTRPRDNPSPRREYNPPPPPFPMHPPQPNFYCLQPPNFMTSSNLSPGPNHTRLIKNMLKTISEIMESLRENMHLPIAHTLIQKCQALTDQIHDLL